MRVFALKSCDTCRKALRTLRDAGIAPSVIDIRSDGVAEADIDAMMGALGDAVLNRKSTTWRGLTEAEREHDIKALLTANPTLIKRPVIEAEGEWTVGWTAAVEARWLG